MEPRQRRCMGDDAASNARAWVAETVPAVAEAEPVAGDQLGGVLAPALRAGQNIG